MTPLAAENQSIPNTAMNRNPAAVPKWLRHVPRDRRVLLLHSGRTHTRWARRSIVALPGNSDADTGPGPLILHSPQDHPWQAVRESFERHPDRLHIGYLSYDLGRSVERLPATAEDDRDWPVLCMDRCDRWLEVDHVDGTARDHGNVLNELASWLQEDGIGQDEAEPFSCEKPTSNLPRERYRAAVQRAIDYIAAGDVFQVNLSQRFSADYRGDPRRLFERLAAQSPAWYGAFLELPRLVSDSHEVQRVLASISPELFLQVEGDQIVTRPIKGTRAVVANSQDQGSNKDSSAADLLNSRKDAAELNMIIDLMRNDLGRVCDYGSVKVSEPRHIETHPTVHQGVATVTGRLHRSRNLVDLLKATMPGGSITGAPKVRAMEIIEQLEPVRRGPYCGAIGYALPGERRMAFNITIRTLALRHNTAAARGSLDFGVGAGIVADSDPQAEYLETLDKARAIVTGLGHAI